jgi:hypothetical protein
MSDSAQPDFADLLDQLERTTQLPRAVLGRVVADVIDHYRETVEQYVRRRHTQLQAAGSRNDRIWVMLQQELSGRPVAAPPLTERQLRRIVYG